MVQSADMKPADSAFNAVNTGCQSIAKNIAAWNKLNAETLPTINKLFKDQKVETLPVAAAATAPPPCAK
jgi:hypothetical protein